MNFNKKYLFLILILSLILLVQISCVSAENKTYDNPTSFLNSWSSINSGDVITINSGTATVNKEYELTKSNVTIIGNGTVTFDGNKNDGKCFKISGSYITINGITFKNFYGKGSDGNGGVFKVDSSANYWNIINCNFTNNEVDENRWTQGGCGAVIYIDDDVENWNITGCNFINNNAEEGGGAIYFNAKATNIYITNCNFTGNIAEENSGGAIDVEKDATNWNIADCIFKNNKADDKGTGTDANGGAININAKATNINITNCNFTSNSATKDDGGAIFVKSEVNNWNITESSFHMNTAADYGGVMCLYDKATNIRIYNCNFTNNTGNTAKSEDGDDGGVIWVQKAANNWIINQSTFRGNTIHVGNGGAIALDSTAENWVIIDCNFTENSADEGSVTEGGCGASIYVKSSVSNWNITKSNFNNNTAEDDGGAIYFDDGTTKVKLNDCKFIGNIVKEGDGGAVYLASGDSWVINNCKFSKNTLLSTSTADGGSGAVIYAESSINSWNIKNSNFTENLAKESSTNPGGCGGVIYIDGNANSWNITGSNFNNNTAEDDGGVIYVEVDANNWNLNNCNFINNTAKTDCGGVIYIDENAKCWILNNCNFTNNTAGDDGGAIEVWGAGNLADVNNWTLTSCNFNNNKAANDGGALEIWGDANYWKLNNCNFTNNTANNGNGGAIDIYGDGNVWDLQECNLNYNQADDNGGVIYINKESDDWLFNGCNFTGNTANVAGVIYTNEEIDKWEIIESNFTNNKAEDKGAVFYINKDFNIIMKNVDFNNNTDRYGAAIYVEKGAKLYIDGGNAVIYNNGEITNPKTIIILSNQTVDVLKNTNVTLTAKVMVFGTNLTIIGPQNVTFKINNEEDIVGHLVGDHYEAIYNATSMALVNGTYSTNRLVSFKTGIINPKINACVNITADDVVYGEDVTIFVNVTGAEGIPTGNVSIYINGTPYGNESLNSSGIAKFTISGLAANKYNITAKYLGNNNYFDATNTTSFEIIGNTPVVNVTVTEVVVYGNNATIIVNVTDKNGKSLTGNVTIKVDETTIATDVTLVNGVYSCNSTILSVGNHIVTVIYSGNGNYSANTTTKSFTINPDNSEVNITITKIVTYGENATITINVTDKNGKALTGNITIKIDGITIATDKPLNEGLYSCNSTILSAGSHIVTVIYSGNGNYSANTTTKSFTINPDNSEVNITITKIVTYGENATITINVTDKNGKALTGNITIKIDGITIATDKPLNEGLYSCNSTILSAGSHIVTVIYSGNENYTNKTEYKNLNVNPATPQINVTVSDIVYGKDAVVIVNVAGITSDYILGTVSININDDVITKALTNGSAKFIVPNLGAGSYTVIATFNEYGNYSSASNTANLNVSQAEPIIFIDVDNIKYSENATVYITVIGSGDIPTGNVSVTVDGKTIVSSLSEGKAQCCIPNLDAGKYNVTVTYNGDNNYTAKSSNKSLIVKKLGTELSVDVNHTSDDEVVLILNLTDINGKPITGEVSVNVVSDNGYKYQKTITVNGTKDLTLTKLCIGHYNVTVTYNTTQNYKASANNTNFDIIHIPDYYVLSASNVVKYYMNGTQYHVYLTDDHGNPVVNETILVTLDCYRWSNLQYNITTNASGIATLDINLIAGEYSIVATFTNATPESNNITVLKVDFVLTANDIAKYYLNGTHYTVKVTSQFGYILPNEVVTVKVYSTKWSKPVTYKIKSNSSGIALLPIKLIAGVYSITATIGNATIYNNIAVYPTLTADNLVKKVNEPANLTAKLVDGQGNPVAGKEVKFTVNKSKTYIVETNSEGIATLPINLDVGTWSFIIRKDFALTRATVKVIR